MLGWVLLIGAAAKCHTMGILYKVAILSALCPCYLFHIYLSLLMPMYMITGNVELCFHSCSVML